MAGFRVLRFTCAQIGTRGLSTEPAVAAFQPTKVAVRTSQSDPTYHTKDDIGKIYTMPEDVKARLFSARFCLPHYFERLCETFCETSIVIRQPAVELIDYLKKADYDRPIIRYALYGKYGCGKSVTLIHALNYAVNNNFIIVYVPSVWKWYHWGREVVKPERDPDTYDLPIEAGSWLKHFESINADLITKLNLQVSQQYDWSPREKTLEGVSLNELVSYGISRIKYACPVIDALMNELKIHSQNNSCKTFLAIDGYNGFFQTSSRLKTAENRHLKMNPSKVSLSKSFLNIIKNDWKNGAAVLVVDDHATVKGFCSSHYPFHVMRKIGVETIDPFIPINVPEYTPLEFHNYLDYFEEMRWLQNPEGRDEIEFITQRNPRVINTYCANR